MNLLHKKIQDFQKVEIDEKHTLENNEYENLSNILKKVGKKYYSSRGKSLNQMIKRIKSKKFNKATISGCIIEKISNSLIIYKENRKKSQN